MMASGIPTPNPIFAPVDSPGSEFDTGVFNPGDVVGGEVEPRLCDVPRELVCELICELICEVAVCVAAASTLLSVL
jgi:hypothetical protein